LLVQTRSMTAEITPENTCHHSYAKMTDFITEGTNLLVDRLQGNLQRRVIYSALRDVLEAVDSRDLARKLSQNKQLQQLTSAWLGEDDARWLAVEQVEAMLQTEKLKSFAARLGIDKAIAAAILADILPEITPKYSAHEQGGDLSGPNNERAIQRKF